MDEYLEYLNKLGLDELKNIHSNIDREKYSDRFELVKKAISKREKNKNSKLSSKQNKIEITSDTKFSQIAVILSIVLLPCGIFIIRKHGIIGLAPGIFFILLSISIGAFGLRELFDLAVIGQFDDQGYEDYRTGIKIPYDDFEIVIRPSHRITLVGIKIIDFKKYESLMSKSHRIKCKRRNRNGNGHMLFTNYNVDMADFMNFIDKRVG